MKIEQTPNGTYRIRQMYKGKKYQVILKHKPTKKEAMKIMSDMMENGSVASQDRSNNDFNSCAYSFIDSLEKFGKSPSTIRGYISILNNLSDGFKEYNISDIDNEVVQNEVDLYASTHSPKSTKNAYGFIRSVMAKYRPKYTLSIKLPQNVKKAEYEPSTDDIRRILEYASGSRYECVLKLCCLSLRRGEAIAITDKDLDGNVLTINKDIVLDRNNNYIIKDRPKTSASNRRILIPDDVAGLIRNKGYAFKGNPHTINEYLHKVQDELGIPRFRLHMLRHFAAAYMVQKGNLSLTEVESYGGWEKGSSVLRNVYSYNLDPEESQKHIVDAFSGIIFSDKNRQKTDKKYDSYDE